VLATSSIIMVLVDCLFATTFGVVLMVKNISSSLLLENILSNNSEVVRG
jgi:hypothetical protein